MLLSLSVQRRSLPCLDRNLDLKIRKDRSGCSGRKGLYVNADNVFDAVKKSALQETRKRNPESPEEWYDNVSEKLALSAIRFALLKQDLDKTITFDLTESLKLIGETGPYMLYTFARATSILSKVRHEFGSPSIAKGELLNTLTEIELRRSSQNSILRSKNQFRCLLRNGSRTTHMNCAKLSTSLTKKIGSSKWKTRNYARQDCT